MKNTIKSNKGFTLIEALIVVIIVGLLAAVGVVKLGSAKDDTLNNLAKTAAADINKGLQRATVANNGAGYSTAVAAVTTTTASTKDIVNALVTAGHFTVASGSEINRAISACANATTPYLIKPVTSNAGTTLKAIAEAGVEVRVN